MKKIALYVTLLVCFNCIFIPKLQANEANQSAIISDLQNSYSRMKSFKAQFNQKLFHRESNTTQSREGTILFEQPARINWKTESPHAEMLIINDKEIWNYLPDEEIAYRYHPSMMESSHAALNVITGQNKISDNFEIEELNDADATKKGLKAFLLYPHEPTPQIVEVQLWIDTKTNQIKKTTILDFYGNTNSIEFTTFTPNVRVKKQDFIFKAPDGIDIEDHYNKGTTQ